MEITGKIIQIFPAQKGTSAKGEWKKQEFILETQTSFPKKICFASWNDKVDMSRDYKDELVKVFFDIESREYNGKWYTDVRPWKLETAGQNEQTMKDSKPFENTDQPSENEVDDGLPF